MGKNIIIDGAVIQNCSSINAVDADTGEFVEYGIAGPILSKMLVGNLDRVPKYIFDGLTNIPGYLFKNQNNLSYVELGDDVESIGDYTFSRDLSEMTTNSVKLNLVLNNKLEHIGNHAFEGTRIDNTNTLVLPQTLTEIGEYAFSQVTTSSDNDGNDCLSIDFNNNENIHSLPDYCFTNSNILISNYDNITSFGDYCFSGCKANNFSIDFSNIKSLGKYCFSKSNISNLSSMTNKINTIPAYCFSECDRLTSIDLPEGMLIINGYAFYNCKNLSSVILPQSLIDIQSSAFFSYNNLNIKFKSLTPPKATSSWCNKGYLQQIKVPSPALNTYKTSTGYIDLSSKIVGYALPSVTYTFNVDTDHMETLEPITTDQGISKPNATITTANKTVKWYSDSQLQNIIKFPWYAENDTTLYAKLVDSDGYDGSSSDTCIDLNNYINNDEFIYFDAKIYGDYEPAKNFTGKLVPARWFKYTTGNSVKWLNITLNNNYDQTHNAYYRCTVSTSLYNMKTTSNSSNFRTDDTSNYLSPNSTYYIAIVPDSMDLVNLEDVNPKIGFKLSS